MTRYFSQHSMALAVVSLLSFILGSWALLEGLAVAELAPAATLTKLIREMVAFGGTACAAGIGGTIRSIWGVRRQ